MYFRKVFPAPFLIVILVASLAMTACGPSYSGYGVILWSADETKIATGSTVAAIAHSQLRKTVQVMLIDENRKVSGDPISVEQWRIQEFSSFGDMRDWRKTNQDYLTQFIRSKKMALVVRSDPAIRAANIIYRLREQEDAKVLSRQDTETDAGGLKGYWYEILTQTGTHGWVFSVQVEPWRLGEEKTTRVQNQDGQLDLLANGNWRPDEFDGMIRTGNYDLAFFKPSTGFFLDQEQKLVHLETDRDVLDFSFKSIDRISRNVWNLSGTTVQITFKDDKTLVVQYQKANEVFTRIFVDLDKNVDDLYQTEIKRRAELIAKLAGTGTIRSGNFGEITIDANGNFTWEGLDALPGRIIPAGIQNNGNITFDLYLAPELRGSYKGVASFNFASPDGIRQVNFLYQWKSDGVQLEFVPNSLIKGREVRKTDSSPSILFFGY
jgi:hypothetical protein